MLFWLFRFESVKQMYYGIRILFDEVVLLGLSDIVLKVLGLVEEVKAKHRQ